MEGSQVSQTRPEPVTFPVYTTGGRAHGRSARPAGRPSPRGTLGHVVTGGVTSRSAPLPNGGSKDSKEGGSSCGTRPPAHGPAPGVMPGGAPLSGSDPPQTHRDSLNALGNILSSGICAENPLPALQKSWAPETLRWRCPSAPAPPKPPCTETGGQEG